MIVKQGLNSWVKNETEAASGAVEVMEAVGWIW